MLKWLWLNVFKLIYENWVTHLMTFILGVGSSLFTIGIINRGKRKIEKEGRSIVQSQRSNFGYHVFIFLSDTDTSFNFKQALQQQIGEFKVAHKIQVTTSTIFKSEITGNT